MLNNLIVSTDVNEGSQRRKFLMSMSFLAVTCAVVSMWTFSLFAKDVGASVGSFELTSLVTPVTMSAEEPPAPEIRRQASTKAASAPKKVVLPEFYDSVGKTAPKDTAGQPNVKDASKFDPSLLERGSESIPTDVGSRGAGEGSGIGGGGGQGGGDDDGPAPPVRPDVPKKPTIISGGVVNGKAVNLVKPSYPAMAKAVRAGGDVNVEVVIDEKGSVVSAKAVSGHPLLRDSAEKAARSSRFSPTMLSNQAVKVSGIIVYRFTS